MRFPLFIHSLQPQEPLSSQKSMVERVAQGSGLEGELSALHISSGKYQQVLSTIRLSCPVLYVVGNFLSLTVFQLLNLFFRRWASPLRWACVHWVPSPSPKSNSTSKPCRSPPGRICLTRPTLRGSGERTNTHTHTRTNAIFWYSLILTADYTHASKSREFLEPCTPMWPCFASVCLFLVFNSKISNAILWYFGALPNEKYLAL